jgi:Flp pilus assembly protein protease CpaA
LQLFTGITAMIICLIFMAFYFFGWSDNATVTLSELIINALWLIFWLAAAAALSSITGRSDAVKASCAFAWLTFILWTGSTVLSFKEVRGRSPTTIPPSVNMI